MGLFSSKKVRTVGTTVSRAIEDDLIPNTSQQSILRAVLNDTSITNSLVDGILNGPGMKFERMWRYAEREYVHGLPNVSIATNTAGVNVVKNVIEQIMGKPVTLEYCFLESMRSTHLIWQHLHNNHAYDHTTNQLGDLSIAYDRPVYLKDFRPLYPQSMMDTADISALNPVGLSGSSGWTPERVAQTFSSGLGAYVGFASPIVDETVETEAARIQYIYEVDGTVQEGSFDIDLTDYDPEQDYFQALARTDEGDLYYFTYRLGAGQYSQLDRISRLSYENPGKLFPMLFFRHHDGNRTDKRHHDTTEYKQTTKMLDMLGIDYQQMGDSIHENPDIDDVEQAILTLGVPINSGNQIDQRYLFEFFNRLYLINPEANRGSTLKRNGAEPGNAYLIEEVDSNTLLSYSQITKRTVAGSIGSPGTYQTKTETIPHTYYYTKVTQLADGKTRETRESRTTYTYKKHLRYQVNSVFYEEITITNLEQRRRTDGSSYNTLASLGNEPEKLLIPVDKTIVDMFPASKREELYMRSLHYVFHSMHVERIKWYESGLFGFVLTVVAIVIAFYTMQPQFAAIAAASTAAAAAWIVIETIVVSLAVSYAAKYTVKALGVENTLIAMAALMVASYFAPGKGVSWMPTAQQMLAAANSLGKGMQEELGRLMSEYNGELQEFNLYKDQATEELDEALELLDTNGLIDPFEFINETPRTVLGEAPENFYERTIHSGNIGTLAIDAVHEYVDLSLRLPTFYDTIKDQYNG